MPASDRFSLIVESQTKGEAELRRFAEAVDNLANVADRAQKRTSAATSKISQDTQQLAARVKNAIQNPLQEAGDAAENFILRYGKIGVAITAGAAAFTVGAAQAFNLVKALGASSEQLLNFADRTGLSVGQTDRLSAAAKVAGVDLGGLERSAGNIAERLADVSGAGKDTADTLGKLGVKIYDAQGQQRAYGQILFESIEALSRVKDGNQQAALAVSLLGRSAQEVRPLIKNFEDLDKTARDAGFGTRDGLIKSLAEADDQIDKVGLQWDILKGKLAGGIVGTVSIIRQVLDAVTPSGSPAVTGGFDPRGLTAVSADGRITKGPAATGDVADVQSLLFGRSSPEKAEAEFKRQRDFFELQSRVANSTADGLQAQIKKVQDDRAKALQAINAGEGSAAELEKKLAGFTAEEKRLTERVKALNTQRQLLNFELSTDEVKTPNGVGAAKGITSGEFQKANPLISRSRPSLFPRGTDPSIRSSIFALDSDEVDKFNAGGAAGIQSQGAAIIQGNAELRKRSQEQQIERSRTLLDLEVRRVNLIVGPGGEEAAIQKITELRLESLNQQLAAGAEIKDVELERLRIVREGELEIQELAKQRALKFKQEVKDSAGAVFDALTTRGGAGIKDFVVGEARTVARTLFQNTTAELFSGASSKFAIPGQRGANGEQNFLGKILANTPFADNSVKLATDFNTQATTNNTAAIVNLTASVAGTSARSGLAGGLGIPGGVVQGGTGLILSALPGGGSAPGAITGLLGPDGLPLIKGPNLTPGLLPNFGSSLGRTIGIAGALAAGGFGVASGIQQGGARGALTAGGSGLGAMAALLPLLGVAGPAAPILAAGALGTALISSFLPDPKKQRSTAIDSLISRSAYAAPETRAFDLTTSGGAFDYNKLGNLRQYGPSVVINVQAMDSKSFEDNADNLAGALQAAIYRGHSVNKAMREAVMPQ